MNKQINELGLDLLEVAAGSYPVWRDQSFIDRFMGVKKVAFWLAVDKTTSGTRIHKTSARDDHDPLFGPSLMIVISPSGGIAQFYESVLSMWLVYGLGRGGSEERMRAEMFAMVAHKHLCSPVKSQ